MFASRSLQGPKFSALLLLAGTGLTAACDPSTSLGGAGGGEDDGVQLIQQNVVGPGLGNLTFAANEQWKTVGLIVDDPGETGGHGNVAMVSGYLATIYTTDGGGANASFAFWDVSNPRNPVRRYNYQRLPSSKLREPHGFGFTTAYSGKTYFFGQSTAGFQIWDWTDPAAATLVKDVVLPGVSGSDYGGAWWLHLQAPYVYVAGGTAGLFVVDASNPAAPTVVKTMTNSQLGLARINQVHVVGNLMLVNYSENGTGMSLLDVSDPANPLVRFTDTKNPPVPYSTLFNGGRLYSAGKQTLKLGAFTVQFDANQQPSGLTRYGVDTGSGLGGGGYLSMQDGLVFGGFSTRWAKFDPRTLPMTMVGSATPVAPYNGDLDFGTVMGNLVMVGNDHGGGSALMVHQTERDTTGPTVNFVNPLDNSTNRNVKSRVGFTFTEAVDLATLSTSTIQVRPIGGAAIAGRFSTQAGMVNFFPSAPLAPNTTYEVVVPAGGVKDWVGNPVPTTFLSRFSTGANIISAPAGCNVGNDTPGTVGTAITFTATGCTGSGLTYSWSFGDGSPATAFAASPTASRTYTGPGHFNAILTVRNSAGTTVTWNRRQTVTFPVTASRPTRSTTIVHDASRGRVSVVNSDGNTVASLDAASPFSKRWEAAVGKNPRTLAQPAPGGDLWVVNQDDATVSVLDGGNGSLKATITLPRGSRPYAVAFNPAGTAAYVTLEGTGRLLRLNPTSRAVTGTLEVGPQPRGLAVSHDGARIFVTRLVSPDSGGEVREVSGATFTVTRTFVLPEDTTTPSTEADGPGLPNYVQALTITPDGRGAWVPSKKDNIRRGTGPTSDGLEFEQDARLRTIVSKLDLVGNSVDLANRKDINDGDLANAVELNPLGDFAYVTLQGNNRVEVYDALSHNAIATITDTGLAPRGLVLVGTRLFVQSFMSRNVTVFDVAGTGGSNTFAKLATVNTQASELLAAPVLKGKQIFYNAADPRMSMQGYTSCASCHLDGDQDGRVWDFTQFGEGVRATASLIGRGGTSEQGPVHWTGNFDEIQDFENDMRGPAFGGSGFLTSADFVATSDPLGAPKAGRSADLDALAAYVTSLRRSPDSPYRNPDGSMTAEAVAGKALFDSAEVGCATCHSGAEKSDSAVGVLHDVGTLGPASGKRRGGELVGFDTPSLLGAWATAPYLHDHSAATLLDVLTTRNPNNLHGVTSHLTAAQLGQLVAYLQQLDDGAGPPGEPPPPSPLPSAPTGLAATAGNAQVALSWSAAGGATSYTVKRSQVSGSGHLVVAAGLSGTTFTDAGLSNDATYYYVVTASNAAGEGPASAQASATPRLPPAPAAPTGLTAVAGNAQVTLAWTAVSGATSYTVKRATSSGGSYTDVQAGLTAPGFTVTGLTNGTPSFFVVTASNASGESGRSNEVAATPTAPAAAWSNTDVGAVGAAGSWSEAGGVHTVRGSGADIQNAADAFHFVYRNLTGNFVITARVTGLDNTNTYAKAGVMVRDGLAAGARNMMALTTPVASNGHRMQVRASNGGTTASTRVSGNGTVPVWLRITRSGNTFTSFYSTNGTSWTRIGSAQTLALPTTVAVGLAVTSHVNSTLGTARFESVSLTTP